MDELDKLKNAWKKGQSAYPQFSEKDIYAMLHKTSSSIVKWILIISIMEFGLWLALSFLLKDTPGARDMDAMHIEYITTPMSIISYGIILYFVYVFYTRYKKISTTDNVKTLMQNILKTRKAVSVYIFVNIGYVAVSSVVLLIIMFTHHAGITSIIHKSEQHGHLPTFYLVAFISAAVFIGIFIFIMWLFYKLVYGMLLRRLHKNYEELKKIDL
jgi:hypothetical protein